MKHECDLAPGEALLEDTSGPGAEPASPCSTSPRAQLIFSNCTAVP